MSKIRIKLDQERGYKEGEVISGVVEWQYKKTRKDKPMKVNLLYCTRGRGSKDVVAVDQMKLPSEDESGVFNFTLSADPPSFNGSLISVYWVIEAYYPATKEAEAKEFVVSPTGESIELTEIKQKVEKKGIFAKMFNIKS